MQAQSSSRGFVPIPSQRSWWAEVTQNRIIALVLAMIVAVPLLAAPADNAFTGTAAITLETFALVLVTALLWRAKWDLRPDNVRRFFRTGANLPVVLLFGLITLSCLLSPYKLFSTQELLRTGSGILLYFVVAYHFRQSKHLSLLVSVLLPLSAVVAIGGLAQFQLFSQGRADVIFGNAQPLASFVMLLLPLVAALAWTDKSSNRRIVAMIVSVLMLGCLMLTQGRSAWAGAAAGLLMLAWLVNRSSKPSPTRSPLRARKHQLVWPVLVALTTIGFLAITKSQNTTLDSRVVASRNLKADSSWQSRLQSWQGTMRMVEAKPLTGWGTGLYPLYQHQFTGQGTIIAPDGTGTRVSLAEQAHNFYLQTTAELGLPGLLLTLAVFACFISAGLHRAKTMENGIRRTLLMGSLGATAAFMVDALASPSWQYGQTAMFLWLILGIGTSCLRPRAKRQEAVEIHPASRRVALVSRPMAAGVFLALVTLLPTAYSSAESFDYGSNSSDTQQVVYGTAAVVSMLYLLSTLSEGVVGGAAGTAGAADTEGAAAGSGGFSGTNGGDAASNTTGANTTGLHSTGTSPGSNTDVIPAATPTPTPTPAPTF